MRSAEELFSEVVQLRQMLSTTVEFKRILEMMFCEEAIATNKDVEKYSVHFEGALLKYRVYRKIFKEHLLLVENIDNLHLSKCEEKRCSLCKEPEQIVEFLKSSHSLDLEKLNENQQNKVQSTLLKIENFLSKPVESKTQNQQVNNKNNLKGITGCKRTIRPSTSAESSEDSMENSSFDHFRISKNKNCRKNAALSIFKPPTSKIEVAKQVSEIPGSSKGPFMFTDNIDFKRMIPLPLPDSNLLVKKPFIGENIFTVETPKKMSKENTEENTFIPNKKSKTDNSTSGKSSKISTFKNVPKVGFSKSNQKENSRSILVPVQNTDSKVKCHISDCRMVFENKDQLQDHCDNFHAEPFKCSQCHKIFDNEDSIVQHFQTHQSLYENIKHEIEEETYM